MRQTFRRPRLGLREAMALGFWWALISQLIWAAHAQRFESPIRQIWALFDLMLGIGIVVGAIVWGSLFYAIWKYREKPSKG